MVLKPHRLLLLGLCFLTGICAAASLAQSQTAPIRHAIEGVVLDQRGDPIVDAKVSIVSDNFTAITTTDEQGQFHLNSPSQNSISIQISATGFETTQRKLSFDSTTVLPLRIVLVPTAVMGQVTVTATRTETRLEETAASVLVLDQKELATTAALTLDDALRQVPGFSLFRRNGSRTANPTTQGVSLRGLGASGASRALVLLDGIPLNDPFGSWVYWDRVPRQSIAQVEVLQGAASNLYGSTALGGVIHVLSRNQEQKTLGLELSVGNENTPNGSLFLAGDKSGWGGRLSAEAFSTSGYIPTARGERGLVDNEANSRHTVIDFTGQRTFSSTSRMFLGASFFGEARANGTPLQFNRTHIRQFKGGGEWQPRSIGEFAFRGYGSTQVYDQSFSAISLGRNSEALTRLQRVPAQVVGGSFQWVRTAPANQTLVAGLEVRQIRGASDEIAYVNGRPTSLISSGGHETDFGFYVEDLVQIQPRLLLTAGIRADRWRDTNAFSATQPLATLRTALTVIPDRTETAFSPHLSVNYRLKASVSFFGSFSRAFRAPTLNELYRSFRVGNVLTLANENLRAERLTGGEAGARINTLHERLTLRGSAFWNGITRPVANVTLQVTPSLITRQRQNLGRTRSRGIELESEARLGRYWNVTAGYQFADATVVSFPANMSLEGLRIPQVPRHQLTIQTWYSKPSVVTISFQARASSTQFDDDQNLFPLHSYFVLDAFASRRLSDAVDVFVAAENLLNQRYETGKTPVTTVGPPILIRVGIRLHLGGK